MRQPPSKVFVRVSICFFLPWVFIGASHAAEPVAVSGNVEDNKKPPNLIPGFNVGLYPNDQRVVDERLSNDTTNSDGAYNMYAANIGVNVTELWVTSEMPFRSAQPVCVDLGTNRQAVKASGPLCVEAQRDAMSSNDSNKAGNYAAAVFETRGIQSYTGAMSENDARQQAFYDTYPLIATQELADKLDTFWVAVRSSFQKPIEENEILFREVLAIYDWVRLTKFGE
jgi:hypothetical protein